ESRGEGDTEQVSASQQQAQLTTPPQERDDGQIEKSGSGPLGQSPAGHAQKRHDPPQGFRGGRKTPPPNPLPETERGRKATPPPGPLPETERGGQTFLLPLSASGRGLGGGVFHAPLGQLQGAEKRQQRCADPGNLNQVDLGTGHAIQPEHGRRQCQAGDQRDATSQAAAKR